MVAIMTLKDELIALGNSLMSANEMLAERGIAVKTRKVFMKMGKLKC
jgi:archaeosine-15-forming tRNA-guanine transglycosylase